MKTKDMDRKEFFRQLDKAKEALEEKVDLAKLAEACKEYEKIMEVVKRCEEVREGREMMMHDGFRACSCDSSMDIVWSLVWA